MEETLIYSNVASELLEIFKYFDSELKKKIPNALVDNLQKISNKEYKFEIDKTKELNNQNLLLETKQILAIIYLKYCCSEEEKKEIMLNDRKRKEIIEHEKYLKYNPDDIFDRKGKHAAEVQMINTQNLPWYSKIKIFFIKLFKRKG